MFLSHYIAKQNKIKNEKKKRLPNRVPNTYIQENSFKSIWDGRKKNEKDEQRQ